MISERKNIIIITLLILHFNHPVCGNSPNENEVPSGQGSLFKKMHKNTLPKGTKRCLIVQTSDQHMSSIHPKNILHGVLVIPDKGNPKVTKQKFDQKYDRLMNDGFLKPAEDKNIGKTEPSVYYISEVAEYSSESNPYYSEKKKLRVERPKIIEETMNKEDENTSNMLVLKKSEITSDFNSPEAHEKRDKFHRIKLKVKDIKENAKHEKIKNINIKSGTTNNFLKKLCEFRPMVDREAIAKQININRIHNPISTTEHSNNSEIKFEERKSANTATNSAQSSNNEGGYNKHFISKYQGAKPAINVHPSSVLDKLSNKHKSQDVNRHIKQKLNDVNTGISSKLKEDNLELSLKTNQFANIINQPKPLKKLTTSERKVTLIAQMNAVSHPNYDPLFTSNNHLLNHERKNSMEVNHVSPENALFEVKKPLENESEVIKSVSSRSNSFKRKTPSPSFNMWLLPKKDKLSKRIHKHSKHKPKQVRDAETPKVGFKNSINLEIHNPKLKNSDEIVHSFKKEKKSVKDNTNENVNTDVKSNNISHFDVPTFIDIPEKTNSESLNQHSKHRKIHSNKKYNILYSDLQNGESKSIYKKSSTDIETDKQSSSYVNNNKNHKGHKKSKCSSKLMDGMQKENKKASDVSENENSKREISNHIKKTSDVGKSEAINILDIEKENTTKLKEDQQNNPPKKSNQVKINSKTLEDNFQMNEIVENCHNEYKNSVSREKNGNINFFNLDQEKKPSKISKIQDSNNIAKKAVNTMKENNGKSRKASKLKSNSKNKNKVIKYNSDANFKNDNNNSCEETQPQLGDAIYEIPAEKKSSVITQRNNIEADLLEQPNKGKIFRKTMKTKKPKQSDKNYQEKIVTNLEEFSSSLPAVSTVPDEIKDKNVKKFSQNVKSIPNNEPTTSVSRDSSDTATENQTPNESKKKYSTDKNKKTAEKKNYIPAENQLLLNSHTHPIEKGIRDGKKSADIKLERSFKNDLLSEMNNGEDSSDREISTNPEKVYQQVEGLHVAGKENLENTELANKLSKSQSTISNDVKEKGVKSIENNPKISGDKFDSNKNAGSEAPEKMLKNKRTKKEEPINNESLIIINDKTAKRSTPKPTKPIASNNQKPTNAADLWNQKPTKAIDSFNSKRTNVVNSSDRKETNPIDPVIPKTKTTVTDLPNPKTVATLFVNNDGKINNGVKEISTKAILRKMKEVNYPEIPSGTLKSGNAIECGKQNPVNKRSELIARPMMYTGQETRYGETPWFAVIISKETKQPICGATVITPYLVISAAHCFKDYERNEDGSVVLTYDVTIDQFYIGLGKLSRELIKDHRHSRLLPAAALYVKNEYRGQVDEYKNDIALIEIDGDAIQYSRAVLPACLRWSHTQSTYPPNETEAWLTGIGRTGRQDEEQLSSYVKTAKLWIYPLEKCEARMNFTIKLVGTSNICAGHIENAGGAQMRMGDSGGGLTIVEGGQHYLYGIASLRESKTNLGFYTNVMHHIKWINEINAITNNKRALR